MVRVLGVIAIKGGVGKTTFSSSLATSLVNHYGKKVLLVDANYSAPNLGLHMDIVSPDKTIHDVLANKVRMRGAIHNKYGVDVIPGSYNYNERLNYLKLRDKINSVKNDYDFVIIDSSPSLNAEVLSTILASDNLFLMSTPDYPTIACSLRAAKLAEQRGRKIDGIVINKIRDPEYEIDLDEIEETTGIPVVGRIPDDKVGTRAIFTRIPISIYNKRSGFGKEIDRISRALTGGKDKWAFLKKLIPDNFRKEDVNRELLKKEFYSSVFEKEKEKSGEDVSAKADLAGDCDERGEQLR